MKRHLIQNAFFLAIFLIANTLIAQNQISGVVNYHENEDNPLPEVTIELVDNNDNIIATTLSNVNGEFEFSNIPSGEYLLKSSATLPVGEVNLVDASLILQYLFGWITLNDIEYEAADVDDSGSISFNDYINVLINYFMGGTSFPAGDWQFIDVNVDVSSRSDDDVTVNATSTGDLEGIWMPGGRTLNILPEENQNATVISNQEIELEIGSSYNDLISGFNLNLTYPVNLVEITDVTGPDENFHYNLDENTGVLKVIWLDENKKPGTKFYGETLFRIKVKQISQSAQIKEGFFSLLEGGMVLDNKSNEIGDISITLPTISTASTKLELKVSSYPNPVMNNLNLKITSPVSNNASIFIYDVNGRLVQQITNSTINKGAQIINLNIEDLPSGNYIYKVNLQGNENIRGRFQKTN